MRLKKNIFSGTKSANVNEHETITIEELRQCPEFSHLDDSLAQNVINSIQEFCSIIAQQYNNLNDEVKIRVQQVKKATTKTIHPNKP